MRVAVVAEDDYAGFRTDTFNEISKFGVQVGERL